MPEQRLPALHERPARRGVWRFAWLPVTAALVGILVGVHPLWWPQTKQLLLFIGQARLAAVDPALPGAE